MGLSDKERSFMEAGRAAGYSDDELVAKVKSRRASGEGSPYKPTNYAAEAAKLPAQDSGYQASIDSLMSRGLTADQAAESLSHTEHLSTRGASGRERDEDVYANDPMATMVLSGVLGAGAGSLVGGVARPILSGAVNSATQAAVTGGDAGDIGENALIGAAIPALGAAARGVGGAIRSSEGGQARQLWEKHGGNVGPLDSGSGVPEIEGMAPSRRNVGKASRIAARNVREELANQFDEGAGAASRGERVVADASPEADRMRDISPLRGKVADLYFSEKTPAAAKSVLKQELDHLDGMRAPDGRVMVTERQLDDLRQRLQGRADTGEKLPSGMTLKDKAFRAVARTSRELADEGPYADANKIYSEGMRSVERDRELMDLGKRQGRPAVEDRKVGRWIRNAGNDSEAAGAGEEPGARELFIARHPELERQLDLPDLVRAKGKLEFGLSPGKTHNLIQQAEHVTALKKYLDLFSHNVDAVNGRMLYTPAGAASDVGRSLQSEPMNQIMAALAAQREQERQRAEALGR